MAFALGAAIAALPSAGMAQDPATNTVGPPGLRDFQLEGERTIPSPPVRQVAPPVPVPPRAERPPPTRPQAAPVEIRRDPPPREKSGAPAPQVETALPPVVQDMPEEPLPLPAPVADSVPVAAAAEPAPGGNIPWAYGLGALVAGLGAFALLRGKRRPRRARARSASVSKPVSAPLPLPDTGPRPWLELEFKPAKAAATDARATVEFELVIRNVGEAPALNIRAEGRMFNAGEQQNEEIGAFFAAPGANVAAAPRPLPPQGEATLTSIVTMRKDQVREVVVQGRRLFIPMVAFNVLYDWGDGKSGQTSQSYLVGRETEPPAEKMAPFRLDLGPRIYRSVGFRPAKQALSV